MPAQRKSYFRELAEAAHMPIVTAKIDRLVNSTATHIKAVATVNLGGAFVVHDVKVILSVCNGLGRIAVGIVFDRSGRRRTMLLANGLTILAAGITLTAVLTRSLPLCVAGLCATGFSYGSAPTITSAFTSGFYGTKHFPLNYSVMNFNLMGASFAATAAGSLVESTGGYAAPFILLLSLAGLSLFLNLCIRKP